MRSKQQNKVKNIIDVPSKLDDKIKIVTDRLGIKKATLFKIAANDYCNKFLKGESNE